MSKVTIVDNVTLITLENLPNQIPAIYEILSAIGKESINVDMINQSVSVRSDTLSLSFTIGNNDFQKALTVLGQFKEAYPRLTTQVNSGNTKICVYSELMRSTPGYAARVFGTIMDKNIELRLITTSEMELSLLVAENDTDTVLKALKDRLQLG